GGSIRSSFTGGQFTRAVRFEAFCHVSRTAKFILLPEHRPLVGPIYPALSAAMTAEAPPAAGPSTARARPLTVKLVLLPYRSKDLTPKEPRAATLPGPPQHHAHGAVYRAALRPLRWVLEGLFYCFVRSWPATC